MGPVEAVVGILTLMVLVVLMQTSTQEVMEHNHVSSKEVGKRRKQLFIHTGITIVLMTAALIAARKCWQIWTAPIDYNLAVIPADPSDGWAAAAVGLVIVAFAGLLWLMILRAKFKAVRNLNKRIK